MERLPWGVGLVSARGLWSGPGKGTRGEGAPSLHGTIALLREGCFGALGGKTQQKSIPHRSHAQTARHFLQTEPKAISRSVFVTRLLWRSGNIQCIPDTG